MEMNRGRRPVRQAGVLLIVAGLSVAGCAKSGGEAESESHAATVRAVKGTELSNVTLTKEAARRIDVQTEAVGAAGAGEGTRISYAAVLYDPEGVTWTFMNTEGRTFVRKRINVDHIEGDVAFLTRGPAAGTKVVTVGATQLYGAELGVGEDE
jgi:hypothetical protein